MEGKQSRRSDKQRVGRDVLERDVGSGTAAADAGGVAAATVAAAVATTHDAIDDLTNVAISAAAADAHTVATTDAAAPASATHDAATDEPTHVATGPAEHPAAAARCLPAA